MYSLEGGICNLYVGIGGDTGKGDSALPPYSVTDIEDYVTTKPVYGATECANIP